MAEPTAPPADILALQAELVRTLLGRPLTPVQEKELAAALVGQAAAMAALSRFPLANADEPAFTWRVIAP